MSYSFSRTIAGSFEDAVARVTEALKKEGFGILTDINVKETLKKKLNVDFPNYRILGACNPPMAYQALQAEDKIGTMLPCNVLVQERPDSEVEISAPTPSHQWQLSKTRSSARSRARCGKTNERYRRALTGLLLNVLSAPRL